MLLLTRRLPLPTRALTRTFSSTPSPSDALSSWAHSLTFRAPIAHTDTLTPLRALQLHHTLPTRLSSPAPALSSPFPPGHSLILFPPLAPEPALGADGTNLEYNAPAPYTRRMWAGGSFEWPKGAEIRVGRDVEESVRVEEVDVKAGMVFVKQLRELREKGSEDVAVRERRTHVFRPPPTPEELARPSKKQSLSLPTPQFTFTHTPSRALLFRFSALTFNAHRIHYDTHFSQSTEGHADCLVHGPLTALLLVELLGQQGGRVSRFEYRATSPMLVEREMRFCGAWVDAEGKGEGRRALLWAEQDGRVGMRAEGWIE